MAQPGYPPIPPHISGRRGAVPPQPGLPPSTNTPYLAYEGPPLPPPKHSTHHHHYGPSGGGVQELQPVSRQPAVDDRSIQKGKKIHIL